MQPPSPQAVTSYFEQADANAMPYGFVPEIASLKPGAMGAPAAPSAALAPALPGAAMTGGDTAPKQGSDRRSAPAVTGGAEGGTTAAGPESTAQLSRLPVTAVESEEDLEEFMAAARGGRLVVVDFWAEWCKNCTAILVRCEAGLSCNVKPCLCAPFGGCCFAEFTVFGGCYGAYFIDMFFCPAWPFFVLLFPTSPSA